MGIKTALVNGLLPQNYYLTRWLYHLAFQYKLRSGRPLLVYQMGKVGSSSVVETLKHSGLSMPIMHVHVLTAEGIAREEQFYFGGKPGLLTHSGWPNTLHVLASQFLHQQLQRSARNNSARTHKWKVITLVREPVVRNLSGFFEAIELRIPNFYQEFRAGKWSNAQLTDFFLKEYENHVWPLTWFDNELQKTFSLDLYATPFDRAKGYQIYENQQAQVLLLRLENLGDCFQQAFLEFLGIDGVTLQRVNDSQDKEYYPIYQELLRAIQLPKSYLDQMYHSKFVRHFYSQSEIDRFRSRWEANLSHPTMQKG